MNLTNNQTNTNQRVQVLSEYLNPVIIRNIIGMFTSVRNIHLKLTNDSLSV